MAGKLRVFIDADVLLAGAASTMGASHIVLRMAELTLLDCVASQQVIREAEANLSDKLEAQLPAFRMIVHRCLRLVLDPNTEELASCSGQAHPKDLPILVAAIREECRYLLTFNLADYHPQPGTIEVCEPGKLLQAIRSQLDLLRSHLTQGEAED